MFPYSTPTLKGAACRAVPNVPLRLSQTAKSRSGGFTLIELLVVIAIISVLASLLFPVFAQAREKARGVTCLSNLKQVTMAELMYAQDYDETFGSASTVFQTDGHHVLFLLNDPVMALLPNYLTSRQTLLCPDRTGTAFGCDGPCIGYGYNWSFYNSWDDGTGMLHAARILPGGGSLQTGKAHAELTQAARTFLFGDTWEPMPTTLGVYDGWNGPGSARHSGGFDFGFADGHAKWVKMRHGVTQADTHIVGNTTRTYSIAQTDTLSPANANDLSSYCSDPDGSDCNAIKAWFLQNTVFDALQ